MTTDNHDLIQQGLDAGIGKEPVKTWEHGMQERIDAESHLIDKLFNLTKRMESFEQGLAANNEATKRIETNTAELIAVFKSWQSAMLVLQWIGKAARPVSYITTAIAAVVGFWYALKGGGKP
jgi:hypothetical protein